MEIFLWTGLIFLLISGILTGVFNSGSEQRSNFHTEDQESRFRRRAFGFKTFLVGIICLGIFALFYFLK
ncbi:DUF5316 family protein [Saccharibacillus sp. JS10]|uniref:DUF5316 family protein n=1 Tax=Saccharibacillus sp. JS10 TaxID=2950552 RepID=UPI00352218AF